jgi:hypothetical protein
MSHERQATVKVYLTLNGEGEWIVSPTNHGGMLDGSVYCSKDCDEHQDNCDGVPDLPDLLELSELIELEVHDG